MFCTTPNITNFTSCNSSGSVGPTGPTGSTGPNFGGQGWCVSTNNDIAITSIFTVIPFNEVDTSSGQYNDNGLFAIGTPVGNITQNGYYFVGSNIIYNHDFNSTSYNVSVFIYKNYDTVPIAVAKTILHYDNSNNDEATIVCSNIVRLTAGDNLRVVLFNPLLTSQSIKLSSTFCCQRVA